MSLLNFDLISFIGVAAAPLVIAPAAAAPATTPIIAPILAGAGGVATAAAIVDQYDKGIKIVFDTLVMGSTGRSIYTAILKPCRFLAAAGFLYSMLPLLKADLHQLKHDGTKIITTFVLILMFVNNGVLGRAIGVGNYAVIDGINKAIGDNLNYLAKTNERMKDMDADKATMLAITEQLEKCLAITRTQSDGTPNPVFTACDQAVRSKLALAEFKSAALKDSIPGVIGGADLTAVAGNLFKVGFGIPGWIGEAVAQKVADTAMVIPQAIFDAWKGVITMITKISFALALTILPVPLALSLLYPAPFQAWLTGLWSLGIFQWLLTILSGAFLVMSSTLGGSLPLFFMEMSVSIAAPIVAAALATGGAFGIFKLVEQGAQATIGIVSKVIAAV